MTWTPMRPSCWIGAIAGLLCAQFVAAQSLDDVLEAGEQRILQAQVQQEEIDEIFEATEDLFTEYQQLLRENEGLTIYNNQLQAQIDSQNRTLDSLYTSIDNVGAIESQILPLMRRMIDGLERFISLDIPFLVEERQAEVTRLRGLLSRADQSVATKFNNVLTAWLVEMEDYGSVGETYTDEIVTADGTMREVEILRVGRIALIYVTPDGSEAGVWNKASSRWEMIDPTAIADIQIGITSYETGQPALFLAPVAAPEEN